MTDDDDDASHDGHPDGSAESSSRGKMRLSRSTSFALSYPLAPSVLAWRVIELQSLVSFSLNLSLMMVHLLS